LLIALPLYAYLVLLAIARPKSDGWRSAILIGAIFWGAILAAITELLSLPHQLTQGWLALLWLAACLLLSLLGIVASRRRQAAAGSPPARSTTASPPLPLPDLCLIGGTALLAGIVGLTALLSPPNTWDAMDYHLPRMVEWIANRGVQFFPTLDFAQLIHPPWAQFTMLHLTLLWGSDRLVNLVEFSSFAGSIIGISLIARQLGAGRRGQILAAVICATIFEGVLEASGPMNTYVGAFWLVASVHVLLRFIDDPKLVPHTRVRFGLRTGALYERHVLYLPSLYRSGVCGDELAQDSPLRFHPLIVTGDVGSRTECRTIQAQLHTHRVSTRASMSGRRKSCELRC
jgi:hypothetical protein